MSGRKPFHVLSGLMLSLIMTMAVGMTAVAGEDKTSSQEYLDSLNVGVATLLAPDVDDGSGVEAENDEGIEAIEEAGENGGEVVPENLLADNSASRIQVTEETVTESLQSRKTSEEEENKSDLVMADVQNALNVRAQADEESEKVGVLYKDCGGRILERKDGWTKLRSGDLVGWAKDEYLLFDEEAESLADEVGNLIVTIDTDALRIRREPSTESEVFALMAQDDELDVIEVVDDDWISVKYDSQIGYVSAEFVDLDFHIDEGETISSIKAREKAEAEAKAKLTANQGAVAVGADDTRLLAALIYCEAGNQGYEGHLAVGAAVMNRVRSGAYPNTIYSVIYASGQFTPALNGKVARVYGGNIPDSCITAAQEAINGATNIGTATHFRRAGAHEGIVIGDHVFW
ncbi:MAG TPA: cell wall hydrolase [Lachnospiraceae bacterium]|nr:cell wall hydrolase [Lachnospiraceae bacterium]